MLIRGLGPLLDLRKAGRLPSDVVMIDLSDDPIDEQFAQRYSHQHGVIRSTDNVETLDLRVLVGLHITVFAKTLDERTNRLFIRLQEQAREVVLFLSDWLAYGDDTQLGIVWRKGWTDSKPYPGDPA